TLVSAQPAEVEKSRSLGPRWGGVGSEERKVNARMDHRDAVGSQATLDEIRARALGDGVNGNVAVDEGNRPLLKPRQSRQGEAGFTERSRTEEMVHEQNHRSTCPKRRVYRDLVQRFDNDVEVAFLQVPPVVER